jgi:hypothetical protein
VLSNKTNMSETAQIPNHLNTAPVGQFDAWEMPLQPTYSSELNTESAQDITEADHSLKSQLETLSPSLEARIEQAHEDSSFKQSPEVADAIDGYYKDHYRLGKVIEKVLEDEVTLSDAEAVDSLFGTQLMKETAKDLITQAANPATRGVALFKAQAAISERLLKERVVATETVAEPEDEYTKHLAEWLNGVAIAEGYAVSTGRGGEEAVWDNAKIGMPEYRMVQSLLSVNRLVLPSSEWQNEGLWNDTRMAGQLLFHNTGNINEVARQGYTLRSRTQQRKLTGAAYTQMGVSNNRQYGQHSNLVHWSETYDHNSYKKQAGLLYRGESARSAPGTLAVPLAEMIKIAPYARDSVYGVAELKDGADKSRVTVNDKVDYIGGQGTDYKGKHGEDRVFMADYRADHTDEAINYDIHVGSMNGLQIFTETEMYVDHADGGFGTGEGFPGIVVLPYRSMLDPANNHRTFEDRKPDQERLSQVIKDLQADYQNRPAYKDKVVVPLREGVVEFVAEAAPNEHGRVGREYQKLVVHSTA